MLRVIVPRSLALLCHSLTDLVEECRTHAPIARRRDPREPTPSSAVPGAGRPTTAPGCARRQIGSNIRRFVQMSPSLTMSAGPFAPTQKPVAIAANRREKVPMKHPLQATTSWPHCFPIRNGRYWSESPRNCHVPRRPPFHSGRGPRVVRVRWLPSTVSRNADCPSCSRGEIAGW